MNRTLQPGHEAGSCSDVVSFWHREYCLKGMPYVLLTSGLIRALSGWEKIQQKNVTGRWCGFNQ